MPPIDPRSWPGRLLGYGLLGLGLIAFYAGVAPAARHQEALKAKIIADARMLPRLARIAGQAPALETALAAEAGRADWRSAYIDGMSPALAAATLQRRLADLLALAGAELDQVAVAPSLAARPDQVGVMLQFGASYPALLAVLGEIETGETALAVDHLRIRRVGQKLRVELGVSGLMRPEGGQ